MTFRDNIGTLFILMKREFRLLASRRIYWFATVLAPALCFLFFADLLKDGLPTKLPIAVVDEDNTSMSRQLVRSLDAIPQTEVVLRTGSFTEAREAMQRAEIYGIFHIPADFRQEVSMGKEPLISFYTNDTYFLPASLVYKDMRLQAALANGAVQQTLLLARGEGGPQLQARLMPITVDTNPLHNPWVSYAIYLANILMPAFVCMFAMFTAVFSISEEVKNNTSQEWLDLGHHSIVLSLTGKLLPQTFIFIATGFLYLSILYGYLHFPLNSGLGPMFLAMVLLVVASQGFAVFVTGIARRSRIALSACGLWGVLSFSISGFTYPVRSMPELMQWGAHLFPMRHYYLLYVDQALNGIDMIYSWQAYLSLILFVLLPLLILPKLKSDLMKHHYLP
ncbi:MAG: ABC transporter permease [Odoribacter sp.]